jgi:hypothetical protein
MKVAVAFAGLMASSVFAVDGTRLILARSRSGSTASDYACTLTNSTFQSSDGNGDYTTVNLDAFVYDTDHIKLHMYQYFPATTGTFMATPDNAYADDTLWTTNTVFKQAASDGRSADPIVGAGATRFFRIDYQGDEENSCTYSKVSGVTQYSLNYAIAQCTTVDCDAAETTTDDKSIIRDNLTTQTEYIENSGVGGFTYSYTTLDGQGVPTDNFVISLDGTADNEFRPCVNSGSNQYQAAEVGWTSGASFFLRDFHSSGLMANTGFQPTEVADDASTLEFTPVFKKMCGDSTRVAQVAALSVASVAAGLFSFL